MIESLKGIQRKKFAIWLLLRSNIMRARVGSKIGVVTVGVVANQAIIAKTTWFYLAQVGWVWLRETRFYLLQLFKMSLSFTVDSLYEATIFTKQFGHLSWMRLFLAKLNPATSTTHMLLLLKELVTIRSLDMSPERFRQYPAFSSGEELWYV